MASWEELEIRRRSHPEVIRFGKHAGSKIEDIPRDYKRWLLGQADIDPYLRKALEK